MFVESFADRLPVLNCIAEFLPSLVDIANFFSTCKALSRAYLPPKNAIGSSETKETEKINITVQHQGDALYFKMKMDTAFKKVFLSVAQHLNVDIESVRFEFRGSAITGDQTPSEIGMNDGDEIDCLYQKYKKGTAVTTFGKSIPEDRMIRSTVLLRKLFKRNLVHGLKSFDLPEGEFLSALNEDSAQLSGGFALQVITGQFCDKSDIDLYYGHPLASSDTAMEAVLTKHGFVEDTQIYSDDDNFYSKMMLSETFGPPLQTRVFYKGGTNRWQSGKSIQMISQSKGSLLAARPLMAHDNKQSQCASIPDYLYRFDFTVCCVAFRVSEDEELHWLIPYVKDIMEKKLEATPFLSKIDISGKKGRNKLTRTIERFQKYNLRGYKPTPKLLEMCGLSAEEGIIGRVANLKL